MSAEEELNTDTTNETKLVRAAAPVLHLLLLVSAFYQITPCLCFCAQVRPKVELHSLLQHAGATKDVFTMKEVTDHLKHTNGAK